MKLIMMVTALCMIAVFAVAKDVEIALEAELANGIQAPMIVTEDENASNGKYIWVEGDPLTGGGGSGYAEFVVNIPEDDTYAAWGRTIAWDGNSDSFWFTWNPADPEENPQQTDNFEFRWSVQQPANAWAWDRVNHWLDAGTFEREWELDKGETLITIWTREDATMLDCLFITNNNDATTSDAAGVRMPTDEEREAQITGQAVVPKGKLATIWADIK